MKLSDTAIRRPVTTVVVITALIVFGILGYRSAGLDLYPSIDFPIVTVTTIYPGADPTTIEEKISKPLEDAVTQVSGINTLRSTSLENVSSVVVIFELEKDINVAAQEVRDKVSAALRTLPPDVQPPQVERVDLGAAPVLTLGITAPADVDELALGDFAEKRVKEQLRNIQGVGGIDVIGYRERVIWVRPNPAALRRHNVTMMDVVNALGAQNLEIPAGSVPSGTQDISLKTKGSAASLDELRAVMVMNFMGAVVRLSDVATVVDGMARETSRATVNGRKALTVVIRKQSGTNTVEMAKKVVEALPRIRRLAPPGVKVEVIADESTFIKAAVEDSMFDLLLGALLAVVIIAVFLRNLRLTLIAAIAIPTSVIGTFAFISIMGFTLNFLTLLALSLSVGLLVDDAIVVLENIYRHVEHGEDRRTAASSATEEIGLAVTATTFTLVAVFGPIATTGGIVGRFLKQFGLTVAAAVLISLFVSFTLTPMLSARFVKVPKGNFVTRAVERVLLAIESAYAFLVGLALRQRLVVLLLAGGVLYATVRLAGGMEQEMMPSMDQSRFDVTIETPPGSSLEHTQRAAEEVMTVLRATPGVKYLVASVGGGVLRKAELATVRVELVDRMDRDYAQKDLQYALRTHFQDYATAKVSVEDAQLISAGVMRSALIQYNVRGPSLEKSEEMARKITARMRQAGGYTDIDTTYRTGKPELGLVPDRERAYALGVPVVFLAQTLRLAVAGDKVSEYREGGETYDVRMQLDDAARGDRTVLESLQVRSPSGALVELRNVAQFDPDQGPLSIDRQAGQRQITIFANLKDKVLGAAVAELEGFAKDVVTEPGYVTDFSGQAQFMEENFRELFAALFLAVILIYLLLAAQFESFVHPFTIMLSLPLSVIGAVGALLLTGRSMSILAMIGFIMLMGLVTKNAILLVDFAVQGRRRGLTVRDATIAAGRIRLRPILMTTAAMVFGMLPIAFAVSKGAETRAPMAIAVIGGVLTSTVLTLIVVPVVFSLVESAKVRLHLAPAGRPAAELAAATPDPPAAGE
ncbi:MAG: efflux RND transporter permease subunit [Deltaproteobacteria bacterium]|nr:efflux RND transporter permease subunit [Deltaproteobacteria bacterium]